MLSTLTGLRFAPNCCCAPLGTQSGTPTENIKFVPISEFYQRAQHELLATVSISQQVLNNDVAAIRKYWVQKWGIALAVHPTNPELWKMKYTHPTFKWLGMFAARGVVFDTDLNRMPVPKLTPPIKTFNVGELPSTMGCEFDFEHAKYRLVGKIDGSLQIARSNTRVSTVKPTHSIFNTTSGSFGHGNIVSTSWNDTVDSVLNHRDRSMVDWLDAHPDVVLTMELVSRDNTIVTIYDHGDYPGHLYLLGAFDSLGCPLNNELMTELQNLWITSPTRRLPKVFEVKSMEEVNAVLRSIEDDPSMLDAVRKPEGVVIEVLDRGVWWFAAKLKLDTYFEAHHLRTESPGSKKDFIGLDTLFLKDEIDDFIDRLVPVQLDYLNDALKPWFESVVSVINEHLVLHSKGALPSWAISDQFPHLQSFLNAHDLDNLDDVRSAIKNWFLEHPTEYPLGTIVSETHLQEANLNFKTVELVLDEFLRLAATQFGLAAEWFTLKSYVNNRRGEYAKLVKKFVAAHKDIEYLNGPLFGANTLDVESSAQLLHAYPKCQLASGSPASTSASSSSSSCSSAVSSVPVASSSSSTSASSSSSTSAPSARSLAVLFDLDGTLFDNHNLTMELGHENYESLNGPLIESIGRLVQHYHRIADIYVVTGRRITMRPHIQKLIDEHWSSCDITLVTAPINVADMRTSLYKKFVYRMIGEYHEKVMIFDDDMKVAQVASDLGMVSLPVHQGNILPPIGIQSTHLPTVCGLIGTPGSGKSTIWQSVCSQLPDKSKAIILQTDSFDLRRNRNSAPVMYLDTVDGLTYVRATDREIQSTEGADGKSKQHYDLIRMALQYLVSQDIRYIIIDSCLATQSVFKACTALNLPTKWFTYMPIQKSEKTGKKGVVTHTYIPSSFLMWSAMNVFDRVEHSNLTRESGIKKIWDIISRKGASAATVLTTCVNEIIQVGHCDYITEYEIGGKSRNLETYLKTLMRGANVDFEVLRGIAAEVNTPSIELVGRTILDHLTASSSSTATRTVHDNKYRALLVTLPTIDLPSRGVKPRLPHVTLRMGGEVDAYNYQELLGRSIPIHLIEVETAHFENGSWVTYVRVDIDHPLAPEHPHITLAYDDIHNNLGGAYMSVRALSGEAKNVVKLDLITSGSKITGVDLFLPTGYNA